MSDHSFSDFIADAKLGETRAKRAAKIMEAPILDSSFQIESRLNLMHGHRALAVDREHVGPRRGIEEMISAAPSLEGFHVVVRPWCAERAGTRGGSRDQPHPTAWPAPLGACGPGQKCDRGLARGAAIHLAKGRVPGAFPPDDASCPQPGLFRQAGARWRTRTGK